MNNQQKISDVAKETVYILRYTDNGFVSKIPKKLLNALNKLSKESEITVKIDKDKKLKEQNICEETKDLICLMYYDYIATREEKEEILKIWNKNELLYRKKLREKYNTENLFKNNNENNNKQEDLNLPVIITKERLIEKIIKIFKKLFNIEN